MAKKWAIGIVTLILLIVVIKSVSNKPNNEPIPVTTVAATMPPHISIFLTKSGWQPTTITIKAGTTVTWVNESFEDGSVTSDASQTHTDYPKLNLGVFSRDDSLSLPFAIPGTYGYQNGLKPDQHGLIIVQ